jgi:hypothetical protein
VTEHEEASRTVLLARNVVRVWRVTLFQHVYVMVINGLHTPSYIVRSTSRPEICTCWGRYARAEDDEGLCADRCGIG